MEAPQRGTARTEEGLSIFSVSLRYLKDVERVFHSLPLHGFFVFLEACIFSSASTKIGIPFSPVQTSFEGGTAPFPQGFPPLLLGVLRSIAKFSFSFRFPVFFPRHPCSFWCLLFFLKKFLSSLKFCNSHM